MRLLVALPLLLAACGSFPVPIDPLFKVSPYLANYQLRGKMSMQSPGPVNNPSQSLRQFGFGSHEDDVGVRASLGDGLTGLNFDYYRLDMDTSRTGVLTDDFGTLGAGDTATMSATMDEWRFGWMHEVYHHSASFRQDPLDMHVGLGAVYAYRNLRMRPRTVISASSPAPDPLPSQNIDLVGDAIYPSVRMRTVWRSLRFDFNYAISPDLQLTGDYDGILQDFETRFGYELPYQDIEFFAGWRYSTLKGNGSNNGLGYDADLKLDGFQFGMSVHF
ncbi:MAG: hypothetical protein VYE77_04100 [Planctomycetota bacterium]|nr:hypothetical protein [Planctomycetota bacterium]